MALVSKFKDFKKFCAWLAYRELFLYPHNQANFDENSDVNAMSKDTSLLVKGYIDLKDINEDSLKSEELFLQFKFDDFLFNSNHGITLSQLLALSKSFGTEKISVSGDGYDYEYSEYTSGHDKEIIVTISLENKELLLKGYLDWYEKRDNLRQNNKKSSVKIK